MSNGRDKYLNKVIILYNGDTMTQVIDPFHNKRRYKKMDFSNLDPLFKNDQIIIKRYLEDMELGINVNQTKKGKRSYARLNALKSRIPKVASWIKEKYNKPIIEVTARELIILFNDLKEGIIKKDDGNRYKSYDDYIKDYRAFWNWYIKYMRREQNTIIPDIMQDVEDDTKLKPQWVYFEPDYKKVRDIANFDYQVLMDFLIDSSIRAPKELMNVRVMDIEPIKDDNKAYLHIREETSKTTGRRIKLMFSYPLLKKFIDTNKLKDTDFIFTKKPYSVNKYLKRLFLKVFGDKETKGGKRISSISLYDFRHNSACYWKPRYKTESRLRYRFGWKTGKMIDYYDEFLGFKDSIEEDDLLVDTSKTQLEKQLQQEINNRQLLEEDVKSLQQEIGLIKEQWRELTKHYIIEEQASMNMNEFIRFTDDDELKNWIIAYKKDLLDTSKLKSFKGKLKKFPLYEDTKNG